MTPFQQLVTVFGGSGFVGRHVVLALAKRGYRIRNAVRRPDLAGHLQPMGVVGQIHSVQANLRFPASVERALDGADAVINLVGILTEDGAQRFDAVQAEGAAAIAKAAAARGLARLAQFSAIGADADSPSAYARSKAAGEAAALAGVPSAAVFRPSIIFGPEDGFFNRFAALARVSPALPLIGGGHTKFQPVFVGDVAEAVARYIDGTAPGGRVHELGGPDIRTFRELIDYVLKVTGRKRALVPLPFDAARLQASVMEILTKVSFGLLPKEFQLTRDQVLLLEHDNIVSSAAITEGRTLQGLGIEPQSYEAIVPSYLYRYRRSGQFDRRFA